MRSLHLILLCSFLLAGCPTTQGPAPIEIGAEAPPPLGCLNGRARGVDC